LTWVKNSKKHKKLILRAAALPAPDRLDNPPLFLWFWYKIKAFSALLAVIFYADSLNWLF